MVFVALWMEQRAQLYWSGSTLLLAWAAIEELLKFAAAYLVFFPHL